MFYTFGHTLTADYTEAVPHKLELQMTGGVIHQVDVLFQDGCNHEIYVQIWLENLQLWPSNRGAELRGNATVISFREFFPLTPHNDMLTAHLWSTLGCDWKEIVIQIGLLPKRVLQPLSFEELLTAATGMK